jgi:hypothetical protein
MTILDASDALPAPAMCFCTAYLIDAAPVGGFHRPQIHG